MDARGVRPFAITMTMGDTTPSGGVPMRCSGRTNELRAGMLAEGTNMAGAPAATLATVAGLLELELGTVRCEPVVRS